MTPQQGRPDAPMESDAAQLTHDDLDGMSPKEVTAAVLAGRCDVILGRRKRTPTDNGEQP